ncbi:hypothetical protein [Pseudomonas sp. G2-4]|uniref:hypothetical protein n=1 Tax=Pseudomonas sp. G2-4 TaxID=1506334 RepID=UPI0024BAACEA|nr:hypothetical protein [Pseudomonas sp. G2-4]WHS58363.1 hypothetical protein QNH97_18060 [Pseudomonas sp. G2-4]
MDRPTIKVLTAAVTPSGGNRLAQGFGGMFLALLIIALMGAGSVDARRRTPYPLLF